MGRVSRRYACQITLTTVLCGSWVRRSVAQNNRPARRVAIRGYDPVAYFTEGRPVKGSASFSAPYDEADYYFASAEHQRLFAADPDRYAPRYSGYCAVGVSLDHKAEVDPESWAIANGRLYVFHYKKNMQEFASDASNILAKADANWESVKKAPVFDHGDEVDRAALYVPR
jgi:YHS domain-containing protein